VPLPLALLLVPLLVFGLIAVRPSPAALSARLGARALAATIAGAAGALGCAAFLPAASRDPNVIARTLALLVIVGAAAWALRSRSLDPRVRLALAVLVPIALVLLAWDVSFQAMTNHQNFYLGPANDIRHGRYMLVDDYSQYGVGVIYFLAAILAPLPFGYGSLVLVVGILSCVTLLAVYTVLRVATRSLAFAAIGTFLVLMSGSIATLLRSNQFPSTGFLRFGVPWLLVCALVVAYRRERPALLPLLLAYATVGVAAVWSFETAFYTCATFVVSVLAIAATREDGRHVRCALAHLGAGMLAVILALATLVTATVAGSGSAPRIGGYLDFLRIYSVTGFGQLPIPGWSLGFLIGGVYAVSLAAIWIIVTQARGSALAQPSAIVPLAAVTTFGATSLTYFLGRSHPNNLTHIAAPFVVLLTLWAAHAWRAWCDERHPVAAAGLALAAVCSALLVAQELPQLVDKAPDSALAAVLTTGGPGLVRDVRTLTAQPVISPQTPVVEALIRAHVPRTAGLLVAVSPGIATETLVRLDRVHVLPIGTPEQDDLSPTRREQLVRQARDVRCGSYVVTQTAPLTGSGHLLLVSLVAELRRLHPFEAVAQSAGYRVFKLGCGPA
jgi:hypothetical protein